MSTLSLQEAARALVEKLDEAMPFIDRMCARQQNRGQPYSGPQLGDELEALRSVLVEPVSGGSCDTALETSGDVGALDDDGLHQRCRHPAYEYATTTGPRKAWYDSDKPPEGEGWQPNATASDPDAWERFEYHEESYWRRLKPLTKAAERST